VSTIRQRSWRLQRMSWCQCRWWSMKWRLAATSLPSHRQWRKPSVKLKNMSMTLLRRWTRMLMHRQTVLILLTESIMWVCSHFLATKSHKEVIFHLLVGNSQLNQIQHYTVSGKKRPSPIKFEQFWWNLVHSFLNKFATKSCKCFPPHLNSVSTLPCETWNAHRTSATIELLDRETPEFIQPHLWPANSPDLNPVDNSMWKILQERCTKHASLICNYQRCHRRMATAMTTWSSLVHSIFSRCFSSSRSVMCILYTFSCSIPTHCNQLDSNLANLEAIGINSGVSFSNSAVLVPTRWGFQVLPGSVETLFRWGGKRLHTFAANLFRKLCTRFHQNRPSFVEDITKKHFGLFFPDTL